MAEVDVCLPIVEDREQVQQPGDVGLSGKHCSAGSGWVFLLFGFNNKESLYIHIDQKLNLI